MNLLKRIYWREQGLNRVQSSENFSDYSLGGFSAEDLLEIIDRLRTPLEEALFRGEPISDSENSYLSIMQELTDKLLRTISPAKDESPELEAAMRKTKYLLSTHGCQN